MSRPAVTAEALAKRYRLGSRTFGYRTLGEALTQGRGARRAVDESEVRSIWALRDVSFQIERGEAVGIIGPNGAGKTTLLKILSRITQPTAGRAVVHGRVGSLLEVGTGFHPELTGRENVYLNGAILGMKRSEIAAKFDEIVSFAGVERFLDTPVKRYSTGMYVRLAFAVSAHLEADILLVDEVLSVGDLAFQRKCLGKMQDQTSNEGRTVLFVSHSLGAIKALTERCLWFEQGRLLAFGPTEEVIREYVLAHASGTGTGRSDLSDLAQSRDASGRFERKLTFDSIELAGSDGQVTDVHFEAEAITVRIAVRCHETVSDDFEALGRVRTLEGVQVFSALSGRREVSLRPGVYETSFAIDPNPLRPGVYVIELYCLTRIAQDFVPAAIAFRVEPNPRPDDDPRYAGPTDLGLIRTDFPWTPLGPVAERAGELVRPA